MTGGNNMNPKRLFVGNLTYTVNEEQLFSLFSRYGEVVGVRIIEGKGYGFVEMETYEGARVARNSLNESEFHGRNLLIDDVRPPKIKRGFGQKPGSSYKGKKPASTRFAGTPDRRKGSAQKKSRSSGRHGTGDAKSKPREMQYSERVLTSAPRPYNEKKKPEVKSKPKAAVPDDKSSSQKKRVRFWPGGRR